MSAVNLLWLAPGRVGGSEQYLTRQLAGLPPDATIAPRLLCQPSFAAAHPELARRFATGPLAVRRATGAPARIVAEHTWLPAPHSTVPTSSTTVAARFRSAAGGRSC